MRLSYSMGESQVLFMVKVRRAQKASKVGISRAITSAIAVRIRRTKTGVKPDGDNYIFLRVDFRASHRVECLLFLQCSPYST